MEENSVINCHCYCHSFWNEKDSHRDHPRLLAAHLHSIMTIKAEGSNRRVVTMTTLSFKWLVDSTCSFHRYNRHIHLNSNRWHHNSWTRYSHQVISQSSKNLYTGMLTTTDQLLYTKTKTSSLRRNSKHLEVIILQPPVQPATKISTRRRHWRFSVWAICKHSQADYM